MDNIEKAASTFESGFNCAQSVFIPFAEHFGMDPELALQAACAFGGGIGRQGLMCGAVSGALMALGLHTGLGKPGDRSPRYRTYALAQELMRRFSAEHGSTDCAALLGYNLSIPEERETARQAGLLRDNCPAYVRSAVAILEGLV